MLMGMQMLNAELLSADIQQELLLNKTNSIFSIICNDIGLYSFVYFVFSMYLIYST